jgi:ABC-type multidrug transport system fused ATPase/permease subunit
MTSKFIAAISMSKRQWAILAAFGAVLLLMRMASSPIAALAGGGAQSTGSPAQERVFQVREFKDMPVIVREARNYKSETWHKDLEIEVKNVSTKPIYYMLVHLMFPDDSARSGVKVGIRLVFGKEENSDFDRDPGPDDPHLSPGEVFIFTIPSDESKWLEARQRKYPEVHNHIVFRFDVISFGDGTGFIGESGRNYRTKTSRLRAPQDCELDRGD